MNSLDYKLHYDTLIKQWQVWTPDTTGGCIGVGAGKSDALLNAINNMAGTISRMHADLISLRESAGTVDGSPL